LDALIATAKRTRGVAIGSRYVSGGSVEGWGPARKLLSWSANVYCRTTLGLTLRDCTSGYRCYASRAIALIDPDSIQSEGYSFQIEVLYKCHQAGLTIEEVPIRFVDRVYGDSKVTLSEIKAGLTTVI